MQLQAEVKVDTRACSPSPAGTQEMSSTYLKLLQHCNHNHRSSLHMSALIPLKSVPLAGDAHVGLGFRCLQSYDPE